MNDYMQTLLDQISGSPAGLETGGLLVCISMSLLGSLFVLFTYKVFYENSSNRGLHNSFLIIGPTVTGIFLAIQFSLPLSLGLLGALSIIRFRTPVKDPEEVSYLLILIASSISCATFNFILQGIVLGLVFLIQLAYKRFFGNNFFPYMFLITTGALQSIPKELIEAARVDGASGIQSFWRITFPLLMVSISPLLIGSFAFNFNNFTLIFLLSGGGPPVIGSEVAVGWTDILISFTYKLAISGGRGNMFGLASTVTIIVFGIVLLISALSFRYTKRLERVYGNI